MEVRELRIGNWVNCLLLGNYRLCSGDIETDKAKEIYKPIPLSPDILINCGFDHEEKESRSKDVKTFHVYSKDRFVFNSIHGWWFNGKQLDYQPQYVHQLQNLYYALTQQELKINF